MDQGKLCECDCGGLVPIEKRTDYWLGHVKGQPVCFIRGHNGRFIGQGKGKGTLYYKESQRQYNADWYKRNRDRVLNSPERREYQRVYKQSEHGKRLAA